MQHREKVSTVFAVMMLIVSLLLLSVLSNILAGYPASSDEQNEPPDRDSVTPVSTLVFEVSPASPSLFWSVSTADYYTGSSWLKTTEGTVLDEPPSFPDTNATQVFTVELNSSLQEVWLPLPSADSAFADVSVQPPEAIRFAVDTLGSMIKVARSGGAGTAKLVYKVSWNKREVNDAQISLENIPDELRAKYRQLPNIPPEVSTLADNLRDSSYTVLDQVLADLQFLRTNFVYDVERARALYKGVPQESAVLTYLTRRKGICIDAATLLTVILRLQKIPARISFGYKPGSIRGDKIPYFTTGGHAVTEAYLPPYGWIRFDATPPLQENPLVTSLAFKKQSPPRSSLLYHLAVTNRRDFADEIKLLTQSKLHWNVSVVPSNLRIEALKTVDALLNVTIPSNATLGSKDTVTITAVSLSQPESAFSISVLAQADNITQTSTLTTQEDFDADIIRGKPFEVHGTVITGSAAPIDNMTILVLLKRDRGSESIFVGKGHSENGTFRVECFVPTYVDIGEVRLIPISLGTLEYAASSTESTAKLRATTSINFGSEAEFSLGYGSIHGHLLIDNGTKLANTQVLINVTSLADSSKTWNFQNLTFIDGSFRIRTSFDTPGLFQINATFPGNEYMVRSNATSVARLRLEVPTIQASSEDVAVRGESFVISGTIQFRKIGVWGEHVNLLFDNQLRAVVETGDNGSFTWSFPVSYETKLGSNSYGVAIERSNVSASYQVFVKSKTNLTVETANAEGGLFLLLSASLSDDLGSPIEGARIALDNYGFSGETDEKGNLNLLLNNVRLWQENLRFSISFQGSDLYLPVATDKEVVLEPLSTLFFLLPLVCPLIAAIFVAFSKQILEIRQASRQSVVVEVSAEVPRLEQEVASETQPLRIVFPDIQAPFPNVWGINDKLSVEIAPDSKVMADNGKPIVEIIIDEEPAVSTELTRGKRVGISYTFMNRGEHSVRAVLRRSGQQPWDTQIRVLAVDYREEMIRLYNCLLEKLEEQDFKPRKQMTGREIERVALRLLGSDPEILRRVTTLFEKAEYSNHPIARRDYETMYLSLKELNVNAE